MQNVEITYDEKTWYFSALILSKWIATQAKSLDELIKNLAEAIWLANNNFFILKKFNISFNENYMNS